MKQGLFNIAFIFSLHVTVQAQCVADAGRDTAFCEYADLLNHVLGGNPSGQSADSILFYEWTIIPNSNFPWASASDYIDSINSPNPKIISSWPYGDQIFILKVSDSLGNVCHDSVTIHATEYICLTAIFDDTIFAMIGDTITMYGEVTCYFATEDPPLTFSWGNSPEILTPQSSMATAVVTETKTYYLTITDANGCIATGFQNVKALTTGIEEKQTIDASLYPNPASEQVEISIPAEALLKHPSVVFQLFDITGKAIQTQTIASEKTLFTTAHLPQGIYYWRMASANQTLQQGKFIRQ